MRSERRRNVKGVEAPATEDPGLAAVVSRRALRAARDSSA